MPQLSRTKPLSQHGWLTPTRAWTATAATLGTLAWAGCQTSEQPYHPSYPAQQPMPQYQQPMAVPQQQPMTAPHGVPGQPLGQDGGAPASATPQPMSQSAQSRQVHPGMAQ